MEKARLPNPHARLGVLAERREHVHVTIQTESGRRDADNGVRRPLEHQPFTDRCSASAVTALPEAVADDCDGRRAGAIIAWPKPASMRQLQSENGEELRGNLPAVDILRIARGADRPSAI